MDEEIELVVFETNPQKVDELGKAGFKSFIVDQEYLGKDLRQLGFDTEINTNVSADILPIAEKANCKVWTRINSFGPHTAAEVEGAIANRAHAIILPMVRSRNEVETFLDYVAKRVETCVMVETQEAVAIAADIDKTAVDAVYFGLNDYAIDTAARNIFQPILNGVLERTRNSLKSKRFGFGGLTHPELGRPIPSIMLLNELQRLGSSFTFLRRSFNRDINSIPPSKILQSINAAWEASRRRSEVERRNDCLALKQLIQGL